MSYQDWTFNVDRQPVNHIGSLTSLSPMLVRVGLPDCRESALR